jgi:hypothetical protein
MSRTPIPEHLKHRFEEVQEDGRLFDALVELIRSTPTEDMSSSDAESVAATLVETFRQRVAAGETVNLPFGLVIKQGEEIS